MGGTPLAASPATPQRTDVSARCRVAHRWPGESLRGSRSSSRSRGRSWRSGVSVHGNEVDGDRRCVRAPDRMGYDVWRIGPRRPTTGVPSTSVTAWATRSSPLSTPSSSRTRRTTATVASSVAPVTAGTTRAQGLWSRSRASANAWFCVTRPAQARRGRPPGHRATRAS